MRLEVKKLLEDVRMAGEHVVEFTRGRTGNDYLGDRALRSAVERQFITIGEALSQLSRIDSSLVDTVPESRRIIDFRNILVHGYRIIDDEMVWSIVHTKLPELLKRVASLLSESKDDPQ